MLLLNLTSCSLLELIKKAMKSACRETNAVLAFLWIGVATSTLLMVYYLVLGTSKQKRVGRGVSRLADLDGVVP